MRKDSGKTAKSKTARHEPKVEGRRSQLATPVNVRPAVVEDRPFILETAKRLSSFGPPAWRTADEIVRAEIRTLESYFASAPHAVTLLVAEAPTRGLLGFVYLELAQDYFSLESHGHIGILAIAAEAEGLGVGAFLIRASEAWAREQGFGRLTLNVFDGNRHARAVYEHLGYAPETLRYVKMLTGR